MFEKKPDKLKLDSKPRDDGVELENQFIMRLPHEPARALRAALQAGDLKERLSLRLEPDLRSGELRFDHWLLYAKVVDLPTIIECLKTIDGKNFYKSADICQLMICKEEPDAPDLEKESPTKGKKKDPNKVDKKFLYPHGITPPCKNIRKRRFRKVLKKKNMEGPEIEKEVKRLLRIDNEAVNVRYELINDDSDAGDMGEEDQSQMLTQSKEEDDEDVEVDNDDTQHANGKQLNDSYSSNKDINVESDGEHDSSTNKIQGVAEHDLFGEEVSTSEDDDDATHNNSRQMRELEDASRMSADETRMSQQSQQNTTEFNRSMFNSPKSDRDYAAEAADNYGDSNSAANMSTDYFGMHAKAAAEDADETNDAQMSQEEILQRLNDLRREHSELDLLHGQKRQEIASLQNATLRQRLQDNLDNLAGQLLEKETEIKSLEAMLNK